MSEQDGTPSSTQQSRSRKTNTANQQNSKQVPAAQHPANDDKEVWRTYWNEQRLPWRTEPEIGMERQKYLDERRSITPDIVKGIYPFKDIRLSRADVEWLLATHENGRGPIDWSDESQQEREGVDLRGADLRKVYLRNLPLARIIGGLSWNDWEKATEDQRHWAAIHLERANLTRAHLEEACLRGAHLDGAKLIAVEMKRSFLMRAHLENADLRWAHLEEADLEEAYLKNEQNIGPKLGDVKWEGVSLALLDWSNMKMLGDEYHARQRKYNGKVKNKSDRLRYTKTAVRANRQLAVVLRDQGLNEEADHFAYRAQLLQRVVWKLQRRPLKFIFSWFLYLLAGYGYRPLRSVLWYLFFIISFALAYYTFGHLSLWPPDAFIYSLTSFHGRGFFPGLEGTHSLHDPLIIFAAFEAVIGLFIEISFIATFTLRFFGR